MTAAEIGPDTWRIESRIGERALFQYVVASGDEAVLIDAGTARTPHETILPALQRLAIAPEQISAVIVTHPDLDHQGGVAALAEALPEARLACGFLDRGLVEDPERLLHDRYGAYEDPHGVGYPPEAKRWMRSLYGARVNIDLAFGGGESLVVGDRRLEVLHLPGHSAGHLGLQEAESGFLFSSDAIHWRMCPGFDGSPQLPPTYEEVDAYLETIERVRRLGEVTIHSGHWPARSGNEAVAFLEESREFVAAMDETLHELLESPRSLAELCPDVDQRLGPFGADPVNLMFVVAGHLRRLVARGAVECPDPYERPPRFRLRAKTPSPATRTGSQA